MGFCLLPQTAGSKARSGMPKTAGGREGTQYQPKISVESQRQIQAAILAILAGGAPAANEFLLGILSWPLANTLTRQYLTASYVMASVYVEYTHRPRAIVGTMSIAMPRPNSGRPVPKAVMAASN